LKLQQRFIVWQKDCCRIVSPFQSPNPLVRERDGALHFACYFAVIALTPPTLVNKGSLWVGWLSCNEVVSVDVKLMRVGACILRLVGVAPRVPKRSAVNGMPLNS
jgi:hypothetical protein